MENKVIQKLKNIGSSFVCFSSCTKSQCNCDIENATKSTSTFKEHGTWNSQEYQDTLHKNERNGELTFKEIFIAIKI